jgi:hypothetical protein
MLDSMRGRTIGLADGSGDRARFTSAAGSRTLRGAEA